MNTFCYAVGFADTLRGLRNPIYGAVKLVATEEQARREVNNTVMTYKLVSIACHSVDALIANQVSRARTEAHHKGHQHSQLNN